MTSMSRIVHKVNKSNLNLNIVEIEDGRRLSTEVNFCPRSQNRITAAYISATNKEFASKVLFHIVPTNLSLLAHLRHFTIVLAHIIACEHLSDLQYDH